MNPATAPLQGQTASLVVIDPNGHRSRAVIEPVPFLIGRNPDNHLIIRDSRVSRAHARIVIEDGRYVIEDMGSRHGLFVNGGRVTRHELRDSDRIEFGTQDSYVLAFALEGAELQRLLDQAGTAGSVAGGSQLPGVGGNLAKLRAILELARAVQGSLSVNEVLASVVDAALTVTGAERGFLMLRSGEGLETRVARRRDGGRLTDGDLRVPREVLRRALERRRELLHMNFDPSEGDGTGAGKSVADLELRSVVCVPLVRIRTAQGDSTTVLSTGAETLGLLYLDSRLGTADLAGGNRELIQTLAIEASTVLENARLLEEERAKNRLEKELALARSIQLSLLPRALPGEGWLRASGSSAASRMVGGDYFDVNQASPDCWSAVVADVCGKGPGAALLASLLQGALMTASDRPEALGPRIARLNRFLLDRTAGEKYATLFVCLLGRDGRLSYVNAAHCPPLLARAGELTEFDGTALPVGLVEDAPYPVAEARLTPGDKLVIYTDGVTEAQNAAGEFFGKKRLRTVVAKHAAEPCQAIHDAIQAAVAAFTEGAEQSDDMTLLVLEYKGA